MTVDELAARRHRREQPAPPWRCPDCGYAVRVDRQMAAYDSWLDRRSTFVLVCLGFGSGLVGVAVAWAFLRFCAVPFIVWLWNANPLI